MKIFWSWQSDTPGKTGRHFVRDAISEAIKQVQSDDDIVEPEARDLQREMYIDHDRKGVTGSPDLAKTIFDKIDQSTVFIADVTPMASFERVGEDGKPETKKCINSNVAIELGYALRSLGTEWLLFVCNKHYGSRDDLPFDLKHKSGPIFFDLPADATAEKIKAERKALIAAIKTALKEFVAAAPINSSASAPFQEIQANVYTGTFYEDFDQVVETTQEDLHDNLNYHFDLDSYFYLRFFPRWAVERTFTKRDLYQLITDADLPGFQKAWGSSRRVNRFGAVSFGLRSSAGRVSSLTQVFQSGELWGLTRDFTNEPLGNGIIVPDRLVETVLWATLGRYLDFAETFLKLGQEYQCVFGAVGLSEARISTPQFGQGQTRKFLDGEFEARTLITRDSMFEAYTKFRTALYDAAGLSVPAEDAANAQSPFG